MSTFTFNDLIDWSTKLPAWQSDALRRVLNGSVSAQDVADLAAMVKAAHGSAAAGAAPNPATLADVPSAAATMQPVVLLSVADIANVNALAAGPVDFGRSGLTVIYGDNGSGKSGVARILKKACRARSPGDAIRPSVFEPDPGVPGSASIKFQVGSEERILTWEDGRPSDADLSRVNVCDASCAAVQVEKRNFLGYMPAVLQAFQTLADTCRQVAAVLKQESEALEKARLPSLAKLSLQPDTAAGRLATSLSKSTKTADIEGLCDITQDKRDRRDALCRALKDDPGRQASLVEGRGQRVRQLDDLLERIEKRTSDAEVQELERLLAEASSTRAAATAAREGFAAKASLDGLGGSEWKQLWESARRYSERTAYPGEPFPVTRDDAVCVLCQQPLAATAAERLRAFEDFVRADVQQRAEKALANLAAFTQQLEEERIPFSRKRLRETDLGDAPEGEAVRKLLVHGKLRRRYLLRRANGQAPSPPAALPVRPALGTIRAAIAAEVQQLRAAADAAERVKMEKELLELEERLKLGPFKTQLQEEVRRLAELDILTRARADCDTKWITRKGGEAADLIITSALRSAFLQNLQDLGFGAAPVEVKLGPGSAGQYPYELSLVAKADVPPAQILSEGEKTCVALAGFLAELETTNNGSGIVLDDPVSSLDHRCRRQVSRRLVAAAKERQVIVFTHDVVFLLRLTRDGRSAGVPVREFELRRGYKQHGYPSDGPPWVAMPVGRRIGVLRKELQDANAALSKGDRVAYEQKAEWVYDHLRQSWERAVEEVLLNETVVRFGDGVSTQRLKLLTDISASDVQIVETEMSYCSSFVHDESGAVNAGIPDPPAIQADIKKLEDWVEQVRARRKKR